MTDSPLDQVQRLVPGQGPIKADDINAIYAQAQALYGGLITGHGGPSMTAGPSGLGVGKGKTETGLMRIMVNNNLAAPMQGFLFVDGVADPSNEIFFFPSVVGHLPFVGEVGTGFDVSDLFPRISRFDVLWCAEDPHSNSGVRVYTMNVYTHWKWVDGSDPNIDCCVEIPLTPPA